MALVVLGSAKGSPGVTTLSTALAMCWPSEGRQVFLVEADPSGGSLAARWRLGYEPGLLSLAGAGRHGIDAELLERHSQPLGSARVLAGPPSPDQSRSAIAALAPHLAKVAARRDVDVIVDIGRIWALSPAMALARDAGACVLVCRPHLEQVQHLPYVARALTEAHAAPSIVSIGDKPYVPAEIAAYTELPLLEVVADDRRAADALGGRGGSDKMLQRSRLWRSTVGLAEHLVSELRPRLTEPGETERRAREGTSR